MNAAITYRKPLPSEIDVLVGIDDDAALLYQAHGLHFTGPNIAALAAAERTRWHEALTRGDGELAIAGETPIGFSTRGHVDGKPYLDQLSVLRAWMGMGAGSRLLAHAIAWGDEQGELWLTTYAHLPWNAPMYARRGFVTIDEACCGPMMRAVLREQRAALPAPEQRVAMVWHRR